MEFPWETYNYPTDPSSVAGKLRGSISEEPSAHKLRAYCPSTGLMGHHPATSHATVHLRHQWGMRWCIWSLDIVSCRVLSWEPNALDTPLNLFQHTGTPCFPFTWKVICWGGEGLESWYHLLENIASNMILRKIRSACSTVGLSWWAALTARTCFTSVTLET